MEHVFFPPLSRVAVCGGTHGNEMSGVYMLRELKKRHIEQDGPVSLITVLSNPRAVESCRRYIDKDLNRCFTSQMLRQVEKNLGPLTDDTPYELKRAHELNAQLGPKGSQEAVDLLCDIHNTTSNMGLCLILYSADWIPLHILKHIQSKMTSTPVRAIFIDLPASESYSLESVGKHGLTLEVGPQPNGVLRADIYNLVKEAVELTFEFVQKFNAGHTFEGGEVEAYTMEDSVDYPRDPTTGEITASVHSELQDKDFKLLKPGDPIFKRFSGETVTYKGEELYPFFINECAYYEKKIAFVLGEKVKLTLPPISVQKD
ncbi:N-acyl-aromatic-L-amino acid amidohydrolase (carboxylate-forming) B-like isoform X1 [Takifugu flavidus]|uniref:N-acyl-aromatic-L-amino acid amidohydrolase n=1 Tax=Takifugu flavidus TaxID=433684 RepID=A0A5C6MTW3_9TELE|nr:N-acyl-aromatic-L-amino acid amidohydrolase (carboxylate-forming) B-like isoform X1 [Takifugu flavidus]XP_056891136.1 N-acyl-aromatic-L-amino acid amidohydrolase (carboxylate-forming) B-like isoform X1 [Takifugu flavidus]TWW58682.1 N-acyl-aromatic-L-amino acid amidohydrolase (carboxylate-forming) B [Takifugu flavidus]